MRALIVLLACASFALAGSLKIEGETKVEAYKMVRLSASGVPEGAALVWDVDREEVADLEEVDGRLLFVAPPGKYKIKLRAIVVTKEGKTKVQTARTTIIVGPEKPTPPTAPPGGKADPVQATGKLRFGSAGCTATVIFPRRPDGKWDILTAAHCIGGIGSRGTFTLKDGRTLNVSVVSKDTRPDIAWLVTQDPVENLPYAYLAKDLPAIGTRIWHQGYGVDRPGNRETGTVTASTSSRNQLTMRLSVSSGDSGSGIFREDTGEVVSVVCCTGGGRTYGGTNLEAQRLRPSNTSIEAVENPHPVPIWEEPNHGQGIASPTGV